MSLTDQDREALARLAGASEPELRDAASRMPSYQRASLHWLTRELDLLARAPTPSPGGEGGQAPERQAAAAMGHAALERARLTRQIAESAASTAQKAFMQQTLAHLWTRVLEACPCTRARR